MVVEPAGQPEPATAVHDEQTPALVPLYCPAGQMFAVDDDDPAGQ